MSAIDTSMARRFLDVLGPGEEFTFLTFAESETGVISDAQSVTRVMYGKFDQYAKELAALNTGANPAGIFVTVNRTDGKGRRKGNIAGIRALFVDLDGAPIEPVLTGPLPPTIVVETSPGKYHAYWRTDEVSLADFSRFQKILIAKFGGDPVVHDLPRVMRLPGFLHQKHEPFLSLLAVCDSDRVYSRNQLIEAFGEPIPESAQVEPSLETKQGAGGHGLAMELAGKALRRVEQDKSRGRHKQALALGIESRERGLSAEAAEQAAYLFFESAPATNSDGEQRLLTREEVRLAVLHAYSDGFAVNTKKTLAQHVISGHDIPALVTKPRKMIVSPFITESSLSMVYAKRGVGKTWFALELAKAISTGQRFFKWEVPSAQRVLYVDGEMPLGVLKERSMQLFGGMPPENFMLLPSETLYLEDRPLRINDAEEQKRLLEALEELEGSGRKPDIIIFDNLSSLTSGVDENSNSDMDVLLSWLVHLRHRGYAVLAVHHAGKNGTQRGASRREDLLDTSIKLEEVAAEDRGSAQGASFTIEFEKVRGERPVPDTLTVSLIRGADGGLTWAMGAERHLSAPEKMLLEIAKTQPRSQKDLASTMNITESGVSQTLAKLRERKLIGSHMQILREGQARLRRLGVDEIPL